MAHGIKERDFVFGLQGQGNDWHKLTQEKPGPLTKELFPIMTPVEIQTVTGIALPWQILISADDNQTCGNPYNPKTFGVILPQEAWDTVTSALAGTHFTVERVGMLWDRSFWFVSVFLEELKEVCVNGTRFQLNFSGGLDGNDSPQGELTNIRAVCWNTISASRATGEYLFKVRQTIHSKDRLAKAEAEIEKAVGMAKVFNSVMEQMGNTSCTVDKARCAYAGEVARRGGDFRVKTTKKGEERESRARNTVDELTTLFQSGAGNSGSTRADVLNGFTQFMTRGRDGSKKNIWAQVGTSEFGGNATRKAEFFTLVSNDGRFGELVEEGKEALAIV